MAQAKRQGNFFNMYSHGFVRVAACIPEVRVSDVSFNSDKTIELIKEASKARAVLAVFPELGLTGYSNEDLFFQDALLENALKALEKILKATLKMDMVVIAGAPLKIMNSLFNCAVIIHKGAIKGVAVKSHLPNYREFYEMRHFRPASELSVNSMNICSQSVPVGSDLIFDVETIPGFRFFAEICEDAWVPLPPSSRAALSGATVLCNLSASNITVGKDEYRHQLIENQSARCIAGYIYTAAGPGESTTDLAWDGHAFVYENGQCLKSSQRFSWKSQVICADIDVSRLIQDRMRMTTFKPEAGSKAFRIIPLNISKPKGRILPERQIARFPYVPPDASLREKRCFEVYNIQVQGLTKRLKSSGLKNLVIGVSGGLDSTHALIVCAKTTDMLGLPRKNIKAYTMPGFATSDKTFNNAVKLMKNLGVDAKEIDIKPSCNQMMKDIGHPYSKNKKVYDVTFENVQAGERTSHLFRIANNLNGLVVGTGDLSELALGWCTYGVGDHMSHYNVNASVPKTLIQYILRWIASDNLLGQKVSDCIIDILNTEISPELVPGKNGDKPAQSTQAVIGPYELQDFNTYYISRFGFAPAKVGFLSWLAWHDKNTGLWPDVPEEKRNEYNLGEIRRWLEVFIKRFFKTSQFKRSCIPNGPKVGSGGSLSPRGDYRAPSDSEETLWLEDLKNIPWK